MVDPSSPKVARSKRLRTVLLIIVALVVAAICWQRDFPAIPDSAPPHVERVLSSTDARCYIYSLGGFIDSEYLWRIDGSPEVIAAVIAELGLKESQSIPASFWKMPPYYWPRKLSDSAKPYRSANFVDDSRGPDGPLFFLLHDTKSNRAYVWFKDNF